MSKLLDAVKNATTVMDGAATFIASQRLAYAKIKEQADSAGTDLPALDEAISNLDREAAELTSAMAEGTSAAKNENPTPETAPVVAPDAVPVG